MPKGIFISHTSVEADVAQWLKNQIDRDFLGALSIYVSSDRESISAGHRWLEGLREALRTADLQVLVVSHQSINRPWVNFEAGAGWIQGIPLVPVCHSGLKMADLPAPLSELEAIVLTDSKGLAKLYDEIARTAEMNTPPVDFDSLAAQARELERKVQQSASVIERIESPRILCACSAPFADSHYGFDNDVAVVEKHFPGRVTIDRAATSDTLFDRLSNERFDILHLVLKIDPATGSLVFGDDCGLTSDNTLSGDTMASTAFAALLTESKTRLVVLATCQALLLAVDVARTANMAASDENILAVDATAWSDRFYGLLAKGKSVHKAFDLMRSQNALSIRGVYQVDVRFA
jgi:hypothetical protein